MICPWCGEDKTMRPVPGAAGEMYDQCPNCGNFVPKPDEEGDEIVAIPVRKGDRVWIKNEWVPILKNETIRVKRPPCE